MKRTTKQSITLLFTVALLLSQLIPVLRTNATAAPPQDPVTILVTPELPPTNYKLARLQDAAVFAWQEFIALNWPAVNPDGVVGSKSPREMPDVNGTFGNPSGTTDTPLVWHTFRGKVEIYPGYGNPPGYDETGGDASKSYGYDKAPAYNYVISGIQPADPKAPFKGTPWINLDENNEIGLDMMFAGSAPKALPAMPIGQQIMFAAKANRIEYNYVAANKWWSPNAMGAKPNQTTAVANTAAYLNTNKQDPPAGSNQLVSFPYGTIEIKAAWRQLGPNDVKSRYYTTTARYYSMQNGQPVYVDTDLALVAMHIIQKTPAAPYFIYATFGQADNLRTLDGHAVEDEKGNSLVTVSADQIFDPTIRSSNAISANPPAKDSIQNLFISGKGTDPKNRIYYMNTSTDPTPQGNISLNRRAHNISPTIIAVNAAAHAAIKAYSSNAVWQYYKLINVQYEPYDKPAGTTYAGAPGGPDPATYYLANEVIESNYNLQFFSGTFQQGFPVTGVNDNNLITDYKGNGTPLHNVLYNGQGYNMGGCMGCHGNAQLGGNGFSFIFKGGPVTSPQTVGNYPPTTAAAGVAKFMTHFASKNN